MRKDNDKNKVAFLLKERGSYELGVFLNIFGPIIYQIRNQDFKVGDRETILPYKNKYFTPFRPISVPLELISIRQPPRQMK